MCSDMSDPRVAHALDLVTLAGAPGSASEGIAQLLRETPHPLDRNQFEPGHITASGLVVSGDAVALVFHTRIGTWLQPGGHVDPADASLQAAATREIEEETGLTDLACDGVLDLDIHQVFGKVDEPVHLHFDVRFAFRASRQSLLRPGDDVSDARWVPLNNVGGLTSDESVLRMVEKLASSI